MAGTPFSQEEQRDLVSIPAEVGSTNCGYLGKDSAQRCGRGCLAIGRSTKDHARIL